MFATDVDLSVARSALQNKNWTVAEAESRSALRSVPTSAAALCMLASVHSDRGDDVEALRLYRNAIFCSPDYCDAYGPLASSLYSLGRVNEATETYRAWAQVDPQNPEARHMASAGPGSVGPDRCSEEYVKTHFNRFARTFDETLIHRLAYRGPRIIAEALVKHAGSRLIDVLDAGCGTGLCGPEIREHCRSLTGIDLSENMIQRARERNCYDGLFVAELCAFMASRETSFDAIVSSDVLIYFGALEQVVEAMRAALRPEGLLIISTEALADTETERYRLQVTGRYAHRDSYLREVMRHSQLDVLSLEQVALRLELGRRVMFHILVARKLGSGQTT
jgi:predicted TPR repeat methyltransferase